MTFHRLGKAEYKHWIKHKDLYGPLSSITVMGQTIIIIHDAKIAFELMEKRSAIHSSRPVMYFAAQMCGFEKWISFQPHNDLTRAYRKDMHSVVGTKSGVASHSQLQETEIRRYLLRIFRSPEGTVQHLKNAIGAIILQLTYGYRINQREGTVDPLIALIEEMMAGFSDAATPGKWLVDIIPSLRHVPEWLPGGGFKKVAAHYKRLTIETANRPYAFSKARLASNNLLPSVAANLLKTTTPETEWRTKLTMGALYSGGAETVNCSLRYRSSKDN